MIKMLDRRRAAVLAMMLPLATGAIAQEPAESAEGPARWIEQIGGPATLVAIAVVVAGALGIWMWGRARRNNFELAPPEPETPSSKFDMLLAEIQGLSLRVQNGESKGYYRKIETLGRVYLERCGVTDARKLSDADIAKVLRGGKLPQSQSAKIEDILERCRQGSQHESEKLDFTAGELLRELRQLVKQAEETPPPQKEA